MPTVMYAAAPAKSALNSKKKEEDNVYKLLAELHLPSLTQQEFIEQEAIKEIQSYNKELGVDKKKVKNIKVQELGDVEKIRLLYQMFAEQGDVERSNATDVVSVNAFSDLEMFCGGKGDLENHLFQNLDYTQTTVGKIELQNFLLQATSDVEVLKQRQNIIKKLIEDEKLAKEVDAKLAILKNAEKDLLWFWRKMDEEVEKYFNQVFFNKKWFYDFSSHNKDENWLQAGDIWTMLGVPTLKALWPLIPAYTFYFVITMLLSLGDNADAAIKGFNIASSKAVGRDIEPWSNYIDFLRLSYYGLIEPVLGLNKDISLCSHDFAKNPPGAKTIIRLLYAAIAAQHVWTVYGGISNAINHNKVASDMHKRMIGVATFMNTMNDLKKLALKNDTLKQAINPQATMFNVASFEKPKVLTEEMLEHFKGEAFKGDPTFFSFRGRVLADFKKMNDVQHNFVGTMKAVGQLDALVSIAKLYKKHANNTNAQFCFVDYLDQRRPHLNLVDFWHPLLNPDKVVTNSLELGAQDRPKDAIVTGPNAGGKSTSLKAITLAVLLAQSFGIAPARSMQVTPFSLITTYLNIADTTGKESLFQAEMNRMLGALRMLQGLKPSEKGLFIPDECFTGTNPKEGKAGTFGVMSKLVKLPNCMTLLATHFVDVAQSFEKECEQRKVYITRDEVTGRIVYTYTLVEGITGDGIALALLEQEGFDQDILDAANAFNART